MQVLESISSYRKTEKEADKEAEKMVEKMYVRISAIAYLRIHIFLLSG